MYSRESGTLIRMPPTQLAAMGRKVGISCPRTTSAKSPGSCGSRLELLDPVPCSGPLLPLWGLPTLQEEGFGVFYRHSR